MHNKNNNFLMPTLLAIGLTSVSPLQAAEHSRGLYLGLFGGGSSSVSNDFTQSAIAYKREGDGQAHANYDLRVDGTGTTHSKAGAVGGLHIGYEGSEIPMGNGQSGWGLRPAVEFEGYYLGTSVSGNLANPQYEPGIDLDYPANDHGIAAGEHTFKNAFNLDAGVLLINAVFTVKTPWSTKIFPYIGGGIGGAITALSEGDSTQLTPEYEATVNHFNSNPNASSSGFAVQAKAGGRAELVDNLSVFAEYRYLNISATNYVFGQTVYPGTHSVTSNWHSHFDAMGFHSATLGIDYNF